MHSETPEIRLSPTGQRTSLDSAKPGVFFACLLMFPAIIAATATAGQAQILDRGTSAVARLASLEEERNDLFSQYNRLGGQRTLKATQDRITLRKRQIDGIDGILALLSGSEEALKQMKKRVEEKSVFGLGDLVPGKKDAAKHIADKALERLGTEAGSKALGWIGLIGDVVEYGGKKIIKELNVDKMEELVRQNRVNLHDALTLEIALLNDNKKDRNALKELLDLKARYEEAALRYMSEKKRQQKLFQEKRRQNELNPYSARAQCLENTAKLKVAVLKAKKALHSAREKIFKAIEAAPRYGGRFAFLLGPKNVFERHERRLDVLMQLIEDGRESDCKVRYAIQQGTNEINGFVREVQLHIKVAERKGDTPIGAKIMNRMVADGKKFNAKRFF